MSISYWYAGESRPGWRVIDARIMGRPCRTRPVAAPRRTLACQRFCCRAETLTGHVRGVPLGETCARAVGGWGSGLREEKRGAIGGRALSPERGPVRDCVRSCQLSRVCRLGDWGDSLTSAALSPDAGAGRSLGRREVTALVTTPRGETSWP